jgi:serine/threonine protein kinase
MAQIKSRKTYFELIEIAGEGLNSCVYKALRTDDTGVISQTVALKILKSKENVLFWRQEIQSLFQVSSQHCVKVLDFEWVDDQPAVVLEWLEGLTLAELFQGTMLSSELAQEILLQVQEGLIDLHLSGLCHGDLHMQNIFVTLDGNVKLLDFGMANMSRVHEQGSPQLRAPELQNHPNTEANFWTDIYSLGVIASALGVPSNELKTENPDHRELLPGKTDSQLKIALSAEVTHVFQKRELLKIQKTVAASPKLQPKSSSLNLSYGFSLVSLALLMAFGPAASSFHHQTCELQVRTQKWIHLSLDENREPMIYSPATFQIDRCDQISLKWKNSRGQGNLNLSIAKGRMLRLTDRDFR